MKLSKKMEDLIRGENFLQKGKFIVQTDIDAYVEKLAEKAEFLTHYAGEELTAFVAFYCNDPNKQLAFITLVLTNPKFRGKKIAEGLIEGAITIAKQRGFKACGLEVRKENSAALALYQKKNFLIIKEVNDSFLMEKNLSKR